MCTRPAATSVAALIILTLCAPATGWAAGAARTTIAGPEGVLTLTSKAPTGQRGHWFVEFQEEISPQAGPSRVDGRSLKGAADVDCGVSRFQVAKLDVFEGPNFTGALLLDVGHRNEWRSPESGTTLDRVLIATCGRTRIQARVQTEGRAAGGVPADPDLSARSAAPPSAPPAPAVIAVVAQTAAPRIGSSIAPSIASSIASSIVPGVAPSPRPVAPSAEGGAFHAQLAAVGSVEAARQTWERLERAAPAILSDRLRRLTAATVNGRQVYRVSAGGLATKAQAEMVCKVLARLSAQCFVRPGDTP